ncbi:MAG: ArnT family glycosyltransferase, partial [Planctomycetota bacterium]
MDSALSHGQLPDSASATQRRTTWLVALTFGLACLAWLDASSTYHGDEHFYFDAALRIWEGESWWAPEYADGSARVNKPLLSYWLSAGSMELLGPGLFAGRLPFVIAAVAMLVATARLARALLPGEHGAAALVPAMLAATSTTVMLSTRCTPDILLVLGVTCTWVGLAELLVAGRSPASCARWIWGGCA